MCLSSSPRGTHWAFWAFAGTWPLSCTTRLRTGLDYNFCELHALQDTSMTISQIEENCVCIGFLNSVCFCCGNRNALSIQIRTLLVRWWHHWLMASPRIGFLRSYSLAVSICMFPTFGLTRRLKRPVVDPEQQDPRKICARPAL